MKFKQSDSEFLQHRKQLNSVWGSIIPLLIGVLVILYGFLWFTAPMLVNPFAVMNRLQADTVDITTLQTMAVMLPMVFGLLCAVMLVLVGFVHQTIKTERRYQSIITNSDL